MSSIYTDSNQKDNSPSDADTTAKRPTYNLRAVVQRTNLKPDTLRAWERRYGLPVPERTTGGHRVYSEADIQCLLWLIARQDEGMNISQAVKLWRTLEAEGELPVAEESPLSSHRPVESSQYTTHGDVIAELRQRWLTACANFSEREAEQILAQAFALYPAETVCIELLQKGLGQIGLEWYRGKFTTQQEHFASALAMRRLETLLAATPAPTQQGRLVVACPPHENHTFSPLMLTVLLRRRGWDVVYLGANLPQDELVEMIRVIRSDLVILVAQQLYTAASLMEMAQVLTAQKVRVAYGGQVFNLLPALRPQIPAYFLGTEIAAAPAHVERLLMRPPLFPAVPLISEVYREALTEFLQKQAQIDAYVWQRMSAQEIPYSHLAAAKHSFGRDLTAALMLGNLDYLGNDLNWITGLLAYRQITAEVLARYLDTYCEAAQCYLDRRGQIIIDWLSGLLNKHSGTALQEQEASDNQPGNAPQLSCRRPTTGMRRTVDNCEGS